MLVVKKLLITITGLPVLFLIAAMVGGNLGPSREVSYTGVAMVAIDTFGALAISLVAAVWAKSTGNGFRERLAAFFVGSILGTVTALSFLGDLYIPLIAAFFGSLGTLIALRKYKERQSRSMG